MEIIIYRKRNDFNSIIEESTWDEEREVELLRESKGSFGISIVGGKVSYQLLQIPNYLMMNEFPNIHR